MQESSLPLISEEDFFQMIFNVQNRKGRREVLFHNKNRLMTKKGYRNGRKLKTQR